MRKTLLNITGGMVLVLAVLLVGGWLAFVPPAKEPGYRFVSAWGAQGTGPGQFHDPTGLAVADGEVFVADARNGRVQVFSLNGDFLRAFGQPGEGPGDLGRPMNLAVHAGMLYVPGYFSDRIQVFDLAGASKRLIGAREMVRGSSMRRAVFRLAQMGPFTSRISTISAFRNSNRMAPSSGSGEKLAHRASGRERSVTLQTSP